MDYFIVFISCMLGVIAGMIIGGVLVFELFVDRAALRMKVDRQYKAILKEIEDD